MASKRELVAALREIADLLQVADWLDRAPTKRDARRMLRIARRALRID